MTAKHTVLALSLLALTGLSQAGTGHDHRGHGGHERGPRAEQHQPRESFSEETVRKNADGKISRRKVEQTVTDTGFSRKTTFINAEGKTATQELSVNRDQATQTVTRTEKGRDFDGKTWRRESVGERPRKQRSAAPAPVPASKS